MRKIFTVIAALPLVAFVAGATDIPTFETFLGYNFVRFNPNSGYIPSFNANGGGGQFVYNVSRYVGVAVDIGAVTKGTLGGFNVDTTVINYVVGPRFTYHNHSKFTPFGQVLFGGAYSTASAEIDVLGGAILPPGIILPEPISARINASNSGFAMFAGGGLDIKISKHMAFRPVGVDYYLKRLPSLLTGDTTNRNNFRYSAGINFLFGAK